jgi:hypothetical protein
MVTIDLFWICDTFGAFVKLDPMLGGKLTSILTSMQKDTMEFEFENLTDELSDWIKKHQDNNDRKFKREYLPQSIALGPDGMYCVTCENDCSISSNFSESLPALARILRDAKDMDSTAGMVSS